MWMKIDDGLHAHRKTRSVTKSHPEKGRDCAPMGLWILAGSWAARNNRDGWVPLDELDRWDDDCDELAHRLVRAGYWWPETRDGEDGYGFNDWHEWNNPDGSSASGTFGNHVRWHAKKGIVKPGCEHCPTEPDVPEAPESSPRYRPDIAPESGGESLRDHRPESLTRTRPDPTRTREKPCASADAEREGEPHEPHASSLEGDFAEWYAAYPRKRGKGQAVKAYKAARKKADAATLLAALTRQGAALMAKGPEFCPYPATWLNGERWADEPDQPDQPEVTQRRPRIEMPPAPNGLTPDEYAEWEYTTRQRLIAEAAAG